MEHLKTIANYAGMHGVTTTYIYRLIYDGRLGCVSIDGVKFIDMAAYPELPAKRRNKKTI